ncbi:transposase mutator family protein [Clostridium botulinum CFSAN001628]|uniref:Transposase, Mutator family n=1 Tax=Clostridium botulinum (strain Okra / Type B1) TaxID=498213 RepID=B1IK71_CLOBK|nr:transposase, Mutator family [Clostridium botulinum B1 str. Okra]EKX80088.1 transposase mutator family protein [Clostridium botulinum CFSAN001628]
MSKVEGIKMKDFKISDFDCKEEVSKCKILNDVMRKNDLIS